MSRAAAMPKLLTPKALQPLAQGRERSERTLGWYRMVESTLKGSHNRPHLLSHPDRVDPRQGRGTQGALAALATLG